MEYYRTKFRGWCTEIRKGITVDEFIDKNITSLITKRSEAISYELQNMEDKNRTLRKIYFA